MPGRRNSKVVNFRSNGERHKEFLLACKDSGTTASKVYRAAEIEFLRQYNKKKMRKSAS